MLEQQESAREAEVIVIKIGTAALCAQDGSPDVKLLRDLVGEIAGLKRNGHRVIVVSSGAIGIGRKMAEEFGIDLARRADGTPRDETLEKQMAAALGQSELMAIYRDLFAPHGIAVAQALTEKAHFTVNGDEEQGVKALFKRAMKRLLGFVKPNPHIVNFFNEMLGEDNAITIVNENDVAAIAELVCAPGKGFSDNDELAGLIAETVKADRVIFLSRGHGVCRSGDDLSRENVIPFIDFDDTGTLPDSTEGGENCGRGGMGSKLDKAKKLAEADILVHIASSREPGVIGKIMRGEMIGTILVSRRRKEFRRDRMARLVRIAGLHR